jgi:hypothetical protein
MSAERKETATVTNDTTKNCVSGNCTISDTATATNDTAKENKTDDLATPSPLQYTWERVYQLVKIAQEKVKWDQRGSATCLAKYWPRLGKKLLQVDPDLWLVIQEQIDYNHRIDMLKTVVKQS